MSNTGLARMQVESLLGWWALAGVDAAIDEDHVNWLRPRPATPRIAANDTIHDGGKRPGNGYPDDFAAFREFLATAPGLPESGWPGPRLLPAGPQAAKLMIVLPAPDAAAEGGAPLRADATALLTAMMRSIGLTPDQCHIACLSMIAPPGGVIPEEMMEPLAHRMRHHIALAAPGALLLAGDQTSRALLSADVGKAVKNLPFVNHGGSMLAAASILHPRLMLGQPSAKADAWRALRGLVKGWGL
ncbi:MAG: uracil-DNA glycosylase [Sphingobium sp.]